MSIDWTETVEPVDVVAMLGRWSAGSGPLHRQLAGAIRDAVVRGDLPTSTRLPPERTLARRLSVSRSTVVAALDSLRNDGWLERRQGSGTWVRRPARVHRLGEDHPAYVARSPVTFRSLIEGPGDAIELTVAALSAEDVLTSDVLAAA